MPNKTEGGKGDRQEPWPQKMRYMHFLVPEAVRVKLQKKLAKKHGIDPKDNHQVRRQWPPSPEYREEKLAKANLQYQKLSCPVVKSDHRLSKADAEAINDVAHKIENLFYHWNRKACANCSLKSALAYLRQGKAVPKKAIPKKTGQRGCCNGCADSSGHFQTYYEPGHREQREELKRVYGWNRNTGFWSAEAMGCRLPRARRSKVCLTHSCSLEMQKIAREIMEPLSKLRKEKDIID